jgi:GNAT superfamily N-acetyltransferase
MKTIDYSLIKLLPAEEAHREFSDAIKEVAYRGYIEEIWGWDEKVVREYNERNWREKRSQIILYNDQPIGTIYVGEDEESIEIAQFILISEYQNQGIGSHILKDIIEKADLSGRTIKLNYLRQNPVASLYRRTGFQVVAEDKMLYWAERKPGSET